jgi:alkylation response protein AidB-like acyl-CoA dehydrogenase
MDFQLTEDQKIFKQTVHDFAERRIAPLVNDWEQASVAVERELIPEYRDLGLLGMEAGACRRFMPFWRWKS